MRGFNLTRFTIGYDGDCHPETSQDHYKKIQLLNSLVAEFSSVMNDVIPDGSDKDLAMIHLEDMVTRTEKAFRFSET